MSPSLNLVGEAPPFEPEFGPTGALRQDFGETGRVHVDRPLPFIVLHRADPDSGTSLARDVALTSPAYAVWTGPADDAAAAAALDAIIAAAGRTRCRCRRPRRRTSISAPSRCRATSGRRCSIR